MISFEHSIHIDRPIEDVWAYISDISTFTQWQGTTDEASSEGPPQVGTKITRAGSFLGVRNESVSEIIVCEPPTSYEERNIGGAIQFHTAITLAEMNGGTHLTLKSNMEPGGLFKVAEGVLAKQAEKQMIQDFEKLKSILEGVPEK